MQFHSPPWSISAPFSLNSLKLKSSFLLFKKLSLTKHDLFPSSSKLLPLSTADVLCIQAGLVFRVRKVSLLPNGALTEVSSSALMSSGHLPPVDRTEQWECQHVVVQKTAESLCLLILYSCDRYLSSHLLLIEESYSRQKLSAILLVCHSLKISSFCAITKCLVMGFFLGGGWCCIASLVCADPPVMGKKS